MTSDERPWGRFWSIDQGLGYQVKRIEVLPGKRLSYQTHARRAEHWLIVQGAAVVTLEGAEHALGSGDAIDIPVGAAHRVANQGTETLIFIEVQRGDYLGEDDIVRLSDDYGRVAGETAATGR
ncbi:MAG: cupin domain-containing protein [Chloroflexi bacterium]|nr:cupin domain-containing protein [Chloroflexota bacterium]